MCIAKLRNVALRGIFLLPFILVYFLIIMISNIQQEQKWETMGTWCENLKYEYPLKIEEEHMQFGLLIDSVYNDSYQINAWEFEYIYNPKEGCHSSWIEILLVVKSAPKNVKRRATIRETWGEEALNYGGAKLIFSLGQTKSLELQYEIEIEAQLHRDILQANFQDTYLNLTLKTMSNIRWISKYCSAAKYVVLMDDDVILNFKNLLKLFSVFTPSERNLLFNGYVATYSIPTREHRKFPDKFIVSKEEYPFSCYPTYVSGPTILASSNVIKMFDAVIPYVKRFVFEDVYLGIVAMKLGIPLTTKYNDRFDHDGTRINNFTCMVSSHQGSKITDEVYKAIHKQYAHRTCSVETL